MVLRREFRAVCWCPNIFHHKIITSGRILMFLVSIDQPKMTKYLKIVPLPSWWQKFDLNELSISELFEDLVSWNLECKLITPKYITDTYFDAIMVIFNFIFLVCFVYVIFFLTPERAPKAGPSTCFVYFSNDNKHTYIL